jgi:YD repeat-containing protein
MLKSLLHRLYQQGYLQSVTDRGTIHEFSYKYEGRLINQQVTVKPMLEYSALKRICRGAISGNLTDMVTVAMMYNVG